MKRIILLTLLVFGVYAATAQQPAAIDFTQPLVGIDGEKIAGPPAGKPITLGDVAVTALQSQLKDEQDMPGAKKFELYRLAGKVYKNKACHLTAEEIALLKDRIGKVYGPGVVGPAWAILDPNSVSKDVGK